MANKKIWGYIRVSTNNQNTENQRLAILSYANSKGLKVDNWIEVKASTRKSPMARKIDELVSRMKSGDILIVSELSRLGRSVGQIAILVDELLNNKIRIICIKENLEINEHKRNVQTKVITTMFSLFAEIERDLISERTKEGLARARADGKLLGRPKGSLGKSKLDGKQKEIQAYLNKGVNKANIARIYDVSWPTIDNFIRTRGLSTDKVMKVLLFLDIENNSKFVRGKKRSREDIEMFALGEYDMKKLSEVDYELLVPYKKKKNLDETMNDIITEMHRLSDNRNCFIETDAKSADSKFYWE
jgi:DNA invertase Pin-like site-specific DNA recombinase